MAEALKEMKWLPDRAEELWIAWASNVLPVPVSPRIRTGTSDSAAREASFRQRCIESLPLQRSWTLREERGVGIMLKRLIPGQLAKLSERFGGVLNQSAAADHQAGLAFHTDAQGSFVAGRAEGGLVQ